MVDLPVGMRLIFTRRVNATFAERKATYETRLHASAAAAVMSRSLRPKKGGDN